MVRKTTRPNVLNESGDRTEPGSRRAKALKLFWAMFYFRLLLFAVLVPFLVLTVLEVGVSIFQPQRQPILVEALFTWTLAAILGVAGLRIAAILFYVFIPLVGPILLGAFELTIVPLLAFIRDVFTDTPRTFFARVVEFTIGPTSQRRSTILTVGLPFILFCIVFAFSLLTCKSYYDDWLHQP